MSTDPGKDRPEDVRSSPSKGSREADQGAGSATGSEAQQHLDPAEVDRLLQRALERRSAQESGFEDAVIFEFEDGTTQILGPHSSTRRGLDRGEQETDAS